MPISSTLQRILSKASQGSTDPVALSRQIMSAGQPISGGGPVLVQYPGGRKSGSSSKKQPYESFRDKEERIRKEEEARLTFAIETAKQKESIEARKTARDFSIDNYKEAFKQRNKLEIKQTDFQNKVRFKVFERELTEEDRFRKIRNDAILNRFREARTNEIISKPKMKQFESDLRRIEEGDKAKNRFDLEQVKQQNRAGIEAYKQEQALKLRAITEGLLRTRPTEQKQVKETHMQEFNRMRKSGAFGTVKDIARLGAEQKFKGASLQEITELRAAQFGIKPVPIGGRFSRDVFKGTPAQRWQEWLNTPLPEPDIDGAEAGVRVSVSFGNKEIAERSILQKELVWREAGEKETVIQDTVRQMRAIVENKYPDIPSNYDSMKGNDERFKAAEAARRPSTEDSGNIISEQIRSIYDDILSGIDEKSSSGMGMLKNIQSVIEDIQSTEGGRIKESEKRSRLRQTLGYSPAQEETQANIEKENAAEDFYNKKTESNNNLDSARSAFQKVLDKLRKKR